VYADIDRLKTELFKDINRKTTDLKQQYTAMIKAFDKFQADVVSLVSTAKAAIDAAKQDVLK
jgi:hypothetical protein